MRAEQITSAALVCCGEEEMSCHLVRLRCERRYGSPAGEIPFWPQADHRLFDVSPHLAPPIAAWFRLRGWEVIEEPI